MSGFDWILIAVAGVSLAWLGAVIRENRELHRLHEQDAADYEAMALKAAAHEKSTDEALGTIVDLYEEALAAK